ncbi:O-antigen ligase family protein [Acaryochloris sp. IP29b_bin.148]|uniref:O-antigen ligase family protein n=1 Tax=Acaryochloris sp. IP29b_bin.148 TaxID=2969218 RepID=UPI00260B5AC5|nr:O-antigen ligase family protein [Acaryochloris sp. IP29b_bin.148]
MKDYFYIFEKLFTVFSIIIYSGGFLSLIFSGGANEEDLSLIQAADYSALLLVYKMIYVVTLILLILRWKRVILVLKKDKLISLVIVFAAASVLWSFDPETTLIRSIALVGTSLFGLYFATRYSLEDQLQNLSIAFGIVVFFSFISAILLPKYGVMSGIHAGAWRGIYIHKNVLGKMMALSASIFLVGTTDNQYKMLSRLGLSLSIVLLILSKSSSAIGTFVALFAIFLILKIFRWHYKLMVPALLAILLIGMSGLFFLTEHMDMLLISAGKDPTLTGRTDLWIWALDDIGKRPWFGYGYGAFWQDFSSKAALIRYAAGWHVPHAHNGLLDLLLDLGILGVFVLILGIFRTSIQSFFLLKNTTSTAYVWPLLFVSNMVLANMTETTLMVRNDLFWVIFITISFSVLSHPKAIRRAPVVNRCSSNCYT